MTVAPVLRGEKGWGVGGETPSAYLGSVHDSYYSVSPYNKFHINKFTIRVLE